MADRAAHDETRRSQNKRRFVAPSERDSPECKQREDCSEQLGPPYHRSQHGSDVTTAQPLTSREMPEPCDQVGDEQNRPDRDGAHDEFSRREIAPFARADTKKQN